MPTGKEAPVKRETFRPPWVRGPAAPAAPEQPPAWTARRSQVDASSEEAKRNDTAPRKTSFAPTDKKADGDKVAAKAPLKKQATIKEKATNGVADKKVEEKTTKAAEKKTEAKPLKPVEKKIGTKVEDKKSDEKVSKVAAKPPAPVDSSKSQSKGRVTGRDEKLPPRKPSLPKQLSREEMPLKKWRDPLHERVKDNIDKTLANEVPKGHTLTKNESLRSLLKPTPPPMPPPLPPKLPPPPEFRKTPVTQEKLKRLETLKSRPRRRPDWTDMMKEVEQGRKLKHVVCNDRSSPVITRAAVVKTKDSFIFESEKDGKHNELLKQINQGIRLKKVKTNDRSKPNLEGLRKFRRQMTIEEQIQKSMSQANLAAAPNEIPPAEEEEIDEMDDIDHVRDDLQSTKQMLALELRNREAQERENKRLLTRIQNLEAELARERAIIRQEQQKSVISVTDAYDERLVHSLKAEVEHAKRTADDLEKKYLQAAEERDDVQTELEEAKRKNAELEKKLQMAISNDQTLCTDEEPQSFYVKRQLDYQKQCALLNITPSTDKFETQLEDKEQGVAPSNVSSRRSSHAIRQLSVQKDSSFEEEDEESSDEEEETEERKQKRLERDVKNMRNKIRHLKEKKDKVKRERVAYKLQLKNQQYALKNEKKKYKELKREVDKMAAMMKEAGSEDEGSDEESSEEEEKKQSSEEEETESETEEETESETESESEPEDAPLTKKKDNLTSRVKRHETSCQALKKGNHLLMANVDRLKDDVNKQREESASLQKELDSLLEDLE